VSIVGIGSGDKVLERGVRGITRFLGGRRSGALRFLDSCVFVGMVVKEWQHGL